MVTRSSVLYFILFLFTASGVAGQDTVFVFTDTSSTGFARDPYSDVDSLLNTKQGYAVRPFYLDTLFVIYHKHGSATAEDRAKAVTRRIHELADEFLFDKDSLVIDSTEYFHDIVYKGRIIMSISNNDALWAKSSRYELALNYRDKIGASVIYQQEELSIYSLLKKAGLGVLVLILLIVVIKLIGRAFRWLASKIESQENRLIKGIKIRSYTLYNAESQVRVLLKVNMILKWLLIIIVVYTSLPALFGIFPWTKNLADTLLGFILNPVKKMALGLWRYLPNLFTLTVVIIVFRYFLKLLKYLKKEIARGALRIPGFYPDWANPTYQIIRVLVIAFMIVVIFPYLPGSDSPIFKGVSVFLGFLFTFGSAGSISNVISGLILTYMRLYRRGDRIRIGDVTGDVIEKTMLVTRLRTIKNEIISIPNSTIMNNHTINYSSEANKKGLILHTTVTIGYDVPWKDVHAALIEAAGRTEHLLEDPEPFVLQTSLDDFYVAYQVNAYTKEPNKQTSIYSDLHQNIQDTFNEKGIEILSPHYRGLRDGNDSTIPSDYLPGDYISPSFRISKQDTGKNS